MKALSIRQPWAWLILHAGKDVENRTWPTNVRGRVLIHASKGMTAREYREAITFAVRAAGWRGTIPSQTEIERGGIVGSVEIVDCVTESDSPWFMPHPYRTNHGFVLRNPEVIPFRPCNGALNFFEVDL